MRDDRSLGALLLSHVLLHSSTAVYGVHVWHPGHRSGLLGGADASAAAMLLLVLLLKLLPATHQFVIFNRKHRIVTKFNKKDL